MLEELLGIAKKGFNNLGSLLGIQEPEDKMATLLGIHANSTPMGLVAPKTATSMTFPVTRNREVTQKQDFTNTGKNAPQKPVYIVPGIGLVPEEASYSLGLGEKRDITGKDKLVVAGALASAASPSKGIGQAASNLRLSSNLPGAGIAESLKNVSQKLGSKVTLATKQTKKIEDNSLMVLHNLTESGYNKAKDIGGLANPSVAVIDINKSNFSNYGDISLVGDKYLPFSGKGKTFASDIYSPRFPSTDTIIKDFSVIKKELGPFEAVSGERLYNIDSNNIKSELQNSSIMMAKFLKDEGIPMPTLNGDEIARRIGIKNKMREFINSTPEIKNRFLADIDYLVSRAGGKEKIFTGYTPSGNRKYVDLTAENASKEMSKLAIRAGENWNHGLGSVRARVVPELSTIQKIKQNQNKLVTHEDFEKLKTAYEQNFSDLLDNISKYDTRPDSNPFINRDEISESVSQYIGGDSRYIFNRFKNIPPNVLNEMELFKDSLKNMPTEYFETKFKRVVQPGEFKHAVVPDNTSPETIKRMENEGLNIVKYKTGDENDKMAKLKELSKTMAFSALLAIFLEKKENTKATTY